MLKQDSHDINWRGFGPPSAYQDHRHSLSFIEVETGKVCLGTAGDALHVNALGSCIAVALFDPPTHRGVLAHVMLPGEAPENATEPYRYAVNAIAEALRLLGTEPGRLTAWLAGGANVLRDPEGDPLCQNIRVSVLESLARQGISIQGSSLGGNERRSILMVVGSGEVYTTKGDEPARQLTPETGEQGAS